MPNMPIVQLKGQPSFSERFYEGYKDAQILKEQQAGREQQNSQFQQELAFRTKQSALEHQRILKQMEQEGVYQGFGVLATIAARDPDLAKGVAMSMAGAGLMPEPVAYAFTVQGVDKAHTIIAGMYHTGEDGKARLIPPDVFNQGLAKSGINPTGPLGKGMIDYYNYLTAQESAREEAERNRQTTLEVVGMEQAGAMDRAYINANTQKDMQTEQITATAQENQKKMEHESKMAAEAFERTRRLQESAHNFDMEIQQFQRTTALLGKSMDISVERTDAIGKTNVDMARANLKVLTEDASQDIKRGKLYFDGTIKPGNAKDSEVITAKEFPEFFTTSSMDDMLTVLQMAVSKDATGWGDLGVNEAGTMKVDSDFIDKYRKRKSAILIWDAVEKLGNSHIALKTGKIVNMPLMPNKTVSTPDEALEYVKTQIGESIPAFDAVVDVPQWYINEVKQKYPKATDAQIREAWTRQNNKEAE